MILDCKDRSGYVLWARHEIPSFRLPSRVAERSASARLTLRGLHGITVQG